MLYNQKYKLVQFGLFGFQNINGSQSYQVNVKTEIDNTPYINGAIKTNQMNADFKQDEVWDVQFSVTKDTDIHSLNKQLYGEPQKVFFVEESNIKPWIGKNSDNLSNVNIYFNYGHIVDFPKFNFSQTADNGGDQFDFYSVKIRLMSPYKFLIQNRLRFIEKKNLTKLRNEVWGNYSQVWGGSGVWNGQFLENSIDWFTLGKLEKLNYTGIIEQKCQMQGLFFYDDFWFASEIKTLLDSSSTQAKDRYKQVLLDSSTSQNFTVDTIQLPSGVTDKVQNIGLNLTSSALNCYNVIQIQSKNITANTINSAALLADDWVEIRNPYTNSGFRLTWTSNSIACPKSLLIKSYTQDSIYNGETGEVINPYTGIYKKAFQLSLLPDSTSEYLLTYRNLYPINDNFDVDNSDILYISINSSNTNYNPLLTFGNLPIFN